MARPRSFEPDRVLTQLMNLFWAKGFDGASMQDIEEATGLKKQSLYRLHGDKRQMYLAALEHYRDREMFRVHKLLSEPGPAPERFQRLFDMIIATAVTEGDKRGCFLGNACVDQADADAATTALIGSMTDSITAIFAEALSASEPYASNADLRQTRAAYLVAAQFGLRTFVRAQKPEAVLRQVADQIVAAV
jgi:TetR/AcrR family transcriptional regulator, transcriptional repressor for nem operon